MRFEPAKIVMPDSYLYSNAVPNSQRQAIWDYIFYLLSLLITISTLWFFVAVPPSKLGLLSGDEQYWLNDFAANGFLSYIFNIDAQNPYLSLLSRSVTSVGFNLGLPDFLGSPGMLLVRFVTFSLLALCITLPLFPPARKMLKIQLFQAHLIWFIMLSITNSENIYVFNFSYYLIVPILLLMSAINRNNTNLNLVCNYYSVGIGVCYFVATLFLVNKALIAATLFIGALSLLCINLKSSRKIKNLTNLKLVCILLASLILILISKSEDASLGYSILTFLWAASGIFYAIGSFFLPLIAVSVDDLARQLDLDYLIGAAKLSVFLFGVLSFFAVVKFLKNHAHELSEFKNEKIELLVVAVMLSASIFGLGYSQYSAWYLTNWFISPASVLFIRHFIVPQACLLYLLILLLGMLNSVQQSSENPGSKLTKVTLKITKQIPLVVLLQSFLVFLLRS